MTERLELKAAITVDDAGEITGMAWPFGAPDRVGDVIEKGAIAAPSTLPMLFAHDQGQVIGVWDRIAETDEGLTVKGRLLIEDVARAREVRAMIREKAVTGLSIGFVTKASKPRPRGRTITALDLHEISVVAVPCHPGAQITSMKAADDTATRTHEESMEPEVKAPVANAPEIDTKAFEEIKARLDKIEAKGKRLGVTVTEPDSNTERKAFEAYLRRGVERITPEEVKALTVSNAANGGYLAPEEFGKELIKLLTEYSPVRSYARVVQISASQIT